MIEIAFDIGGTFTDFVLRDAASGRTEIWKVPTTSRDPSQAVLEGLRGRFRDSASSPTEIGKALHATTIATNAILERKGSLVQFSHELLLLYKEGARDAVKVEQKGNSEDPFVLVITRQGGDTTVAVDLDERQAALPGGGRPDLEAEHRGRDQAGLKAEQGTSVGVDGDRNAVNDTAGRRYRPVRRATPTDRGNGGDRAQRSYQRGDEVRAKVEDRPSPGREERPRVGVPLLHAGVQDER